MPCYSQRVIDAAVDSHFVERESLGIVNPSELMWDVLLRTAQIFCSDEVYHEMTKVREEGDFFAVPQDCELLKSIEGLLVLDEPFMRRVSPEFQDDPLRYISMGWSTGGEMNTFREDDIHTLINYLPVAAQRFCYREYEAQRPEQEDEDEDEDYDQEEALHALAGPQSVSTEPAFESDTDSEGEFDDMPELIEDEVIPPNQPGQWSYSLTDSGQTIQICDLTGTNIQLQI